MVLTVCRPTVGEPPCHELALQVGKERIQQFARRLRNRDIVGIGIFGCAVVFGLVVFHFHSPLSAIQGECNWRSADESILGSVSKIEKGCRNRLPHRFRPPSFPKCVEHAGNETKILPFQKKSMPCITHLVIQGISRLSKLSCSSAAAYLTISLTNCPLMIVPVQWVANSNGSPS